MRFLLTWLTFLVLISLPFLSSLQCYHCDRTANVSRPGERRLLKPGNAKCEYLTVCRSPIDSEVTKGDRVGLYNQCVSQPRGFKGGRAEYLPRGDSLPAYVHSGLENVA